jgi:hypothetical protein
VWGANNITVVNASTNRIEGPQTINVTIRNGSDDRFRKLILQPQLRGGYAATCMDDFDTPACQWQFLGHQGAVTAICSTQCSLLPVLALWWAHAFTALCGAACLACRIVECVCRRLAARDHQFLNSLHGCCLSSVAVGNATVYYRNLSFICMENTTATSPPGEGAEPCIFAGCRAASGNAIQ